MGLGQSYLYIYLNHKEQEYGEGGYKVTGSRKIISECVNFEVVTHSINYNGKRATNFDIYIYDSKEAVSNAPYVFAYCSPRANQVANKVQVYYSVLAPDNPLLISFVTDSTKPYNCDVDELKKARWDRASSITEYTVTGDLVTTLKEKYNKLLLKRKIRFLLGKEKVDMFGDRQELGNKINYRYIFTPKGNVSVLGSDYMFAIDFNRNEPICPDDSKAEIQYDCKRLMLFKRCTKKTKNSKEACKANINSHSLKPRHFKIKHPNKIDEYFLRPFLGELYDGIMVYFDRGKEKPPGPYCRRHSDNNNTVLLLEFIDSCKPKTYLRRMDKDGFCWSEEQVKYTSDKDLSDYLKDINSKLIKDEIIVILDKTSTYLGVQEVKTEDKKITYTKYVHQYKTAKNKAIIIFERKIKEMSLFNTINFNISQVDVYYLNFGGKQDKEPFVIVFFSNDRPPRSRKGFHFTNKYEFKDWKAFEFNEPSSNKTLADDDLTIKLYQKLNLIENYGKCITDLTLLRSYTYDILMDKEIRPPPEPPPAKPPEKPKEERPPDEPKPLPVWLIVGCVAAGVVLIVTSVVVYGIYWYNTTIKLLT